jgi:glycosyltransferase involved in cell wall biosynthesis
MPEDGAFVDAGVRFMLKVLFLYPLWAVNATFVGRDFEILARHFTVSKMSYDRHDPTFPLKIFRQMAVHHLCFAWFGGVHSFYALLAARMLGKKIFIVAGGYDAVYLPELNYGIRCEKDGGWRRTYFSFRHADGVFAVSQSVASALRLESGSIKNVSVVYNGVDPARFPAGQFKKRTVLTVGYVTQRNLVIKGFLHFLDAARRLPDERFVLVGGGTDGALQHLKTNAPSNVVFLGTLSNEKTAEIMRQSAVYVQLSAQESFCVALAEAMLCGCTPVVTRVGALPEVAGPESLMVDYGDLPAISAAIGKALNMPSQSRYRNWVLDHYRLEYREQALLRLLTSPAFPA